MSDTFTSVLFTGHRIISEQDKTPLLTSLYSTVLKAITEGYTDFYCGGAMGFDTLAAECVISFRERLKDTHSVRLHLILPCRDQTKFWRSEEDREKYSELLSLADSTEYISDEHFEGCELERNRKMANSSSLCIAFCKHYGSGTGYTVKYCEKIGVRVINLAANESQMTFDIT